MSENTKIEWATHSWNPWTGCRKVSPGCAHCYMFAFLKRFGRDGTERRRTKGWKDPIRWNKQWSQDGPTYSLSRQRVFPSFCDWLDDEVPVEWLADFLKLIHDTPNLDWLLLTKRPDNFFKRLEIIATKRNAADCGMEYGHISQWVQLWLGNTALGQRTPANVWIGTSVEDQTRADERIPELLKIPARVHFISVEPLLGPVDLSTSEKGDVMAPVDWVIIGGESGPGARPCNVGWIHDLVRQCKAAAVATFVKQLGKLPYVELGGEKLAMEFQGPKGGDMRIWPEDLRVREFPV